MAGRSGRRGGDPSSPLVDLDAVFADDAFVDAIAGQSWGGGHTRFISGTAGRAAAGSSGGALLTVDPLTDLLESWRQELAIAPIPAPPSAIGASAPVHHRPPSKSRALRPALAIAAAIAALLVGAASIGSKDAPRDSPLFALTTVLWPSRAASVASADQVGAILAEARSALDDNRVQDAQLALLRATVELGNVDVVDGKGDMQDKVAALWVEAAPQELPTGTQPRESAGTTRPSPPGTRSGADNEKALNSPSLANLTAQAETGTIAAEQLAAPQIVPPPSPSTAVLQAALGPGRPSSQPDTLAGVAGSVATEIAGSAVSGAPVVPVVDQPAAAVPTSEIASTPPPPTAAVDPPVEVAPTDPPSATEQSPPVPTPSESGPSVETTATGSSGTLSSGTDASIPPDPAATGTG